MEGNANEKTKSHESQNVITKFMEEKQVELLTIYDQEPR